MNGLHISPFPDGALQERLANGEMRPYSLDHPPKAAHCGDERFLVPAFENELSEPPARHFGGRIGMAVVGLASIITQYDDGHQRARNIIAQTPNGLAGIGGIIATSAKSQHGLTIYDHSADTVEGNRHEINPKIQKDLGCAFAALAGVVVVSAVSAQTKRNAQELADRAGVDTTRISDIYEGFDALGTLLGGEKANVTRRQAVNVMMNPRLVTPIALVSGEHAPASEAAVVHDFVAYTAAANGIEYFHSTPLPGIALKDALPGIDLESQTTIKASLVAGVATQGALGVQRTLYIA
jgi:hypothetical protein